MRRSSRRSDIGQLSDLGAEAHETSLDVVLYGRPRKTQQLADLLVRPLVRMDEHDARPLTCGQRSQRVWQPRLDVGDTAVARPREHRGAHASTGPALADAVEVARRVVHCL